VHQVFKCDQYLWVVFQVISGFIRSLIYLFHELTEIGLVGKVLRFLCFSECISGVNIFFSGFVQLNQPIVDIAAKFEVGVLNIFYFTLENNQFLVNIIIL
jgi:hypothetical protein